MNVRRARPAAWAHLFLVLLLVAESALIVGMVVYVLPRSQRIVLSVDAGHHGLGAFSPAFAAIIGALQTARHFAPVWIPALLGAWALGEWRFRRLASRSAVRLSCMAVAAVLLLGVVGASAAAVAIPTAVAAEKITTVRPEPIVRDRLARLDDLLARLNAAAAEENWPLVLDLSHTACGDTNELMRTGAVAPAMLALSRQADVDQVRADMSVVHARLIDTWMASRHPDAARLRDDMSEVRKAYSNLRRSAGGLGDSGTAR